MGGPGSGRRKAPGNLQVLRGGRTDRMNSAVPAAPEGVPEPPDWLGAEMLAEWNYAVEQLAAMGTATTADRNLLITYVVAAVAHRKAARLVDVRDVLTPNTVRNPTHAVRNPAVGVQIAEAELLLKLGRELGLTPSGRAGIHTGSRDEIGAERLLS